VEYVLVSSVCGAITSHATRYDKQSHTMQLGGQAAPSRTSLILLDAMSEYQV
jgi:hypothetical protein